MFHFQYRKIDLTIVHNTEIEHRIDCACCNIVDIFSYGSAVRAASNIDTIILSLNRAIRGFVGLITVY